ncbi:hypothetical protein XENOCAPTIV_014838, partial [Xenoophorus captivus]
ATCIELVSSYGRACMDSSISSSCGGDDGAFVRGQSRQWTNAGWARLRTKPLEKW